VRILLPPSEAKRSDGPSQRAPSGAFSASANADPSWLREPRAAVAHALVEFCRRDPSTAAGSLALPARSATADLAANCTIADAPSMLALDRYAGTVYDGLDAATLTAAARRRALDSVLIFSGLFGVVRADEPVPAYRLPVAATLPGIGALTPFWRAGLQPELDALLTDELIIDLRSGDYRAMWRPSGSVRDQVVAVRLVCAQPDGRLAVISYPSKHGKGRLTRALLSSRGRVTSAADVGQRWTDAGGLDAIVHSAGQVDLVTPNITVVRPSAHA
jgi:hypothetical protein